jgi:hypothetical protein
MSGSASPDASRAGRRQLDAIADRLDGRDWAILRNLASFRLMSAQQLRRVHFHGHASPTAAARAASGALRRLMTLGVIRSLGHRVGGNRAGSDGYLWHLTAAGRRLLAASGGGERLLISRFAAVEPSTRLVAHTLAVSEIAVRLREVDQAGRIEVCRGH